jgi:hypothetical protein
MPDQIGERLATLPSLHKPALSGLWEELFHSTPPSELRRDLMVRILAHRLQEQSLGGLSPACDRRLRQLAVAINADPDSGVPLRLLIKPGTRLIREWQSKTHVVHVNEHGYEYNGHRFDSLSEIARLITGTRWSGPLFFGLKGKQVPNSKEVA